MAKALTFWSVIIGFFFGLAYSIGQDLISAIADPSVRAFYTVQGASGTYLLNFYLRLTKRSA